MNNSALRCASIAIVVALGATISGQTGKEPPAGNLSRLTILKDNYPRVFFFRWPESGSRGFVGVPESLKHPERITYREWEQNFDRLMGMEVKALNEEMPVDSSRDVEFATRFKKQHPEQVVLLQFNAEARDPRFDRGGFFAGHWIYYSGARILNDIPAQPGETEIRVSNPLSFRTGVGRFKDSTDDIGLCELDAQGKPDWSRSEQVHLISVNPGTGTIRVARAQYETKPHAFRGGHSYAAAHVSEGPWARDANVLWCYNLSLHCPRDSNGHNCADVLAQDLADRFSATGALASFDGIELDTLRNEIRSRAGRERHADVDADGTADDGVVDGINSYGIGVVEFCRKLRAKLGPEKIIQADGQDGQNQRAFRILNGIESEGFPTTSDYNFQDWSGGLNRLWFWASNLYAPQFNYINHRFLGPPPKPGVFSLPGNVPFSSDRLVFAAAAFSDSAIGYLMLPTAQPGELIGIWDELDMGTAHRIGWLGRPIGPPVRLAERQPDLLSGSGLHPNVEFLKHFRSTEADFAVEGDTIKISTKGDAKTLHFHLVDIPVTGPDLFLKLTARAEIMHGFPTDFARLVRVQTSSDRQPLMTFINTKDFASGFYLSNLIPGNLDLEFTIEGSETVWLSNILAFAYPDAIYREFEHGLVLGNPSPHLYTFHLDELSPNRKYRRLTASPGQDETANNGSAVNGNVTLGPKDGLFLLAEP